MRYKVVVSPTAEADLDDIFRFIALDSPSAARRFVAALRDKMNALAHMPARCPLAPENGLDGLEIRQLLFHSYRILFTIDVRMVRVLRVRHGARLSMWEN